MKRGTNALGLLLLMPMLAAAQALRTEARIRLEGDSTLHRYASTATVVNVSITMEESVAQTPSIESMDIWGRLKQDAVKKLEVTVPVNGLKSGERGLDKNMHAALKAEPFPNIVFTMAGYQVSKDSGTEIVIAQGELSVAGVKKRETINATLRFHDGHAVIDGQQTLLMTDFGIKPPTLMLGALKTDNRVVVKFHLELEQATDEPKGNTR